MTKLNTAIKADIQQQWPNIVEWYYNQGGGFEEQNMSMWDVLKRDYGCSKLFIPGRSQDMSFWMLFPDEQMYTAFLLRWS